MSTPVLQVFCDVRDHGSAGLGDGAAHSWPWLDHKGTRTGDKDTKIGEKGPKTGDKGAKIGGDKGTKNGRCRRYNGTWDSTPAIWDNQYPTADSPPAPTDCGGCVQQTPCIPVGTYSQVLQRDAQSHGPSRGPGSVAEHLQWGCRATECCAST